MITKTREIKPDGTITDTITEEQTSVELSLNSKGQLQWAMKIYADDPEEYGKKADAFLEQIAAGIKTATRLNLAPPQ